MSALQDTVRSSGGMGGDDSVLPDLPRNADHTPAMDSPAADVGVCLHRDGCLGPTAAGQNNGRFAGGSWPSPEEPRPFSDQHHVPATRCGRGRNEIPIARLADHTGGDHSAAGIARIKSAI